MFLIFKVNITLSLGGGCVHYFGEDQLISRYFSNQVNQIHARIAASTIGTTATLPLIDLAILLK
jgi:hypothetical protein